jgi:hypothetical protein
VFTRGHDDRGLGLSGVNMMGSYITQDCAALHGPAVACCG